MKVHSRIQLNLMNGETKFNSDVKRFDHLTLPVFWLEIVRLESLSSFNIYSWNYFQAIEDLTPFLHFVVNMAFKVLPVAQIVLVCLLMLAGVSCLAATLANVFFLTISSEQSNLKFNSKKSIKYTAVFPYIKREMAKFEERERELIQRVWGFLSIFFFAQVLISPLSPFRGETKMW